MNEGTTLAGYGGICYYRVSRPMPFSKTTAFGPRLIVAAQGRKISKFSRGELMYDEDHFLVVTGETQFSGVILEASPDRPYLGMCLELPPEAVARTLLAVSEVTSGPALVPRLPAFVSPLSEPIVSAVTRLICALDDPLDRKVIAPLAIEELVFRLLRTDAAAVIRATVREGDTAIQAAMRYIRDNAARALTVEGVARHVGMSPSHFAHRFSAVARVSPMRFLKHVRLEAARDLLLAERVRAKEAAARVGYESASHFTRDFKVAYGATPTEYVLKLRRGADA